MALDKEKILIVDGHNVIYHSEELRSMGDSAIVKLAEVLNADRFTDFDRIILVFDASEVERKALSVGRVRVVLTEAAKSADNVILQFADRYNEGKVHIASGDWAIQTGAISRGCIRVTPDELLKYQKEDLVISGDRSKRKKSEKPDSLYSGLSDSEKEKLDSLLAELIEKDKKEKNKKEKNKSE